MPTRSISFPEELPIARRRKEIADAVREHQVVIVAGETGSGKTTQLPKILLELGYQKIGHTQPRRIAARAVAERIAEELGEELGQTVGYQVRFTDRTSQSTAIKVMTDGILLAELGRDRQLSRYDAIIIDEAHERSLTIDFLLGYLKRLLPQRPELRVLITSATIDPESFARFYGADLDAVRAPETGDNPAAQATLVAASVSASDAAPAAKQATEAAPETATAGTSATRLVAGVPVIEVSGRNYPVEIRYRPLTGEVTEDEEGEASDDRDLGTGVLDAVAELSHEPAGDVLVFLSGESEIRDIADALTGSLGSDTEVLPLYGRLSSAEQHRVFASRPAGIRRRIVLATNVAETSLTVPGIRYVIDAGSARISRYSTRAKVQRLPIEAISQASARQRAGRAGRTSPGIAIRLYSEEDHDRRPEYTQPEILRTNLAAVLLQMISLRLGRIKEFPFLTPPDSRGVKDGLDLLRELGAIGSGGERRGQGNSGRAKDSAQSTTANTNGEPRTLDSDSQITKVGRMLSRLPVDPRLGRMIIEADRRSSLDAVLAIVAALTVQDVRERPPDKRAQADQQHARFADPSSDFLGLLKLWHYLDEKQRELSGNAFRRLCKSEYLNYLRVREWQDLYRQLRRAARATGLGNSAAGRDHPPRSTRGGKHQRDASTLSADFGAAADSIHRALLAGLLSQIALRDEKRAKPGQGEYLGARQLRASLWPGSALSKKKPAAIMSAELVETSRLFARTNAAIDPAWAEELAEDLVKRSYSEPHWERKQGAVIGYERVTLYGVPIVSRRKIQYSRVDRELARELFIRHALVEGEWNSPQAFDRANRALRERLAEVEERTRRRDILQDDEAVFEFYDQRVPADVASQRDFEGWWRKARAETPDLLTMTERDLLPDEAVDAADETTFPRSWQQGSHEMALSYRFEPGADDDGVTVMVPLELLPTLRPDGFDWQVTGLREELVTAMIKALPKAIRRHVVPAGDWARRMLPLLAVSAPEVQESAGASASNTPQLAAALAVLIRRETHTPCDASDIDWQRVPAHLHMRFAAVDHRGRTVAASRDLAELQRRVQPQAARSVARAAENPKSPLEQSGLHDWSIGTLPRSVDRTLGVGTVRAYPALIDEGETAAVRLLATEADQQRAHRGGLLRLLRLTVPSPLGYVQQHLTTAEKLALSRHPYRSNAVFWEDALRTVLADSLDSAAAAGATDAGAGTAGDSLPGTGIWDRPAYERLRDAASAGLVDRLFDLVRLVSGILDAARRAEKAVTAASSMALIAPLSDAREQLGALVYPGFLSVTGLGQLRRYPAYLAAIEHRVAKLVENPGRDRAGFTEVQTATARYLDVGGTLPLTPNTPAHLGRVRWLLEELRVSVFAQHLGTAEPVSLQRISRALNS